MSRSSWLVLTLFAACATSPTPGRPPQPGPESEAIVWYTSKVTGQLESAWIRGSADGRYTIIATRADVIVADAHELWRVAPFEGEPRTCGGDGPTTTSTQVAFRPLHDSRGVTTSENLVPEAWRDSRSEWFDELTLVGSAGRHTLLRRSGSTYECGAREVSFDRTWLLEHRELTGIQSTPMAVDATTYGPSTDALLALLSEECKGAFAFGPSGNAVAKGIAKRGDHVVQHSALVPTLASPRASCNDELAARLLAHAPVPRWATTPMIERALIELAADGPVGYGVVSLEGAARDAALARFSHDEHHAWPVSQPLDEKRAALRRAAQALDGGEPGAAIAIYDQLLAAEPTQSRALAGRGYAKLAIDDLTGARTDFVAALSVDQRRKFRGEVELQLVDIEDRLGDRSAADAHFLRAFELLRDGAPLERFRARFGVTVLAFDAPVDVRTMVMPLGMPALSRDKKYMVLAHDYSDWRGLGVEIVRLRDGESVFAETLYTYDEEEPGLVPPADVIARVRAGVARVQAKLAEHAWEPLGASTAVYPILSQENSTIQVQTDASVRFDRAPPEEVVKTKTCHRRSGIGEFWLVPSENLLVIRVHSHHLGRCVRSKGHTLVWRLPSETDHRGWKRVELDDASSAP